MNKAEKDILSFCETLKVHLACGGIYSPKKIMKSLSCFCDKVVCPHYKLGKHNYTPSNCNTKTSTKAILSENESDIENIDLNRKIVGNVARG